MSFIVFCSCLLSFFLHYLTSLREVEWLAWGYTAESGSAGIWPQVNMVPEPMVFPLYYSQVVHPSVHLSSHWFNNPSVHPSTYPSSHAFNRYLFSTYYVPSNQGPYPHGEIQTRNHQTERSWIWPLSWCHHGLGVAPPPPPLRWLPGWSCTKYLPSLCPCFSFAQESFGLEIGFEFLLAPRVSSKSLRSSASSFLSS